MSENSGRELLLLKLVACGEGYISWSDVCLNGTLNETKGICPLSTSSEDAWLNRRLSGSTGKPDVIRPFQTWYLRSAGRPSC